MALRPFAITIGLLALILPSSALEDIFGLRKQIYIPRCAHACKAAIADSPLECTKKITSPQCFAINEPYLQTLAFCIASHCNNETDAARDRFWNQYLVGWKSTTPRPIYGYQNALEKAGVPLLIMKDGQRLEQVSRVSDEDYHRAYSSLADWNESEMYHTRFALTIFLLGFLLPVILSLLRFVPFPGALSSKYRAYFVYPIVWSTRWSVSIRDVGDISPTRGQALFIFYMIAINTILSSTGHYALSHHFWSFDGRHGQLITCLANRFGALSLANIPLLFLYSGRNNILLRITNWSHATFLMLHRWLAYITTFEATLHSVLYLHVAVQQGRHTEWSSMPAWYCGSIGTIAICLILPFSFVAIRRRAYELFLLSHIAFSIIILVGTCYHISDLFKTTWAGYVLYLWFAIGFWMIDRLARIARIARNGLIRATITVVDDEYIRVDIPKAKATGHAYLYFPTLTYRFWENHPFSVATTPKPSPLSSPKSPLSPFFHRHSISFSKSDSNKSSSNASKYTLPERPKGITFFMRTHSGTTGHLRKRTSLPVLVESSYGLPKPLTQYPLLICVAGGVGITAILPYMHAHKGQVKLFWGSRSQALVNALREETWGYGGETIVGKRLFVKLALQREFANVKEEVGVAVVVSGPKGMADDVREFVCEVAKTRKGEVRLLDENFGW
ncbi:hypothetical protein EJ08DRAFT_685771 [Tothia fuscella]|uniref:Ferric oxidoreductase domain-containing protein n=1 Tax=Tothia fuscella TaxID=1048955 RepID=A0A9P4P084_9PEZI|nr:hypothetical protein EJ08DRAFT_685771 [Tothia fuscella]